MSKLAEQAGIDFIGIGESHQEYFVTQAHSVVGTVKTGCLLL